MGVLVYDTPLTIDQVLTRLAEQPKAIATLTAGLPRARLHTAPSRGEWSVNQEHQLPRAGIRALVSRLFEAACRTVGAPASVAKGSLVT
jgi:hypothetical protein